MARSSIEINGNWMASMKPLLDSTLGDIGQKVEDAAKRIVPVESGNLRDTITHVSDDDGVSVTAGSDEVGYAAAVELGTQRMAPQPFLRPAATSVGASLR